MMDSILLFFSQTPCSIISLILQQNAIDVFVHEHLTGKSYFCISIKNTILKNLGAFLF